MFLLKIVNELEPEKYDLNYICKKNRKLFHMQISGLQTEYIQSEGLRLSQVETQINRFKKGTQFLDLARPARIVDGIIRLKSDELKAYGKAYNSLVADKSITKFVPASGAATRMFKDLFVYLEDKKLSPFIQQFIDQLDQFAFYNALKKSLENSGLNFDTLIEEKEYHTIIDYLINPVGLSYGNLPKGLLIFHKTKNGTVSPIEEHISEAMAYGGENPKLHFTISKAFETQFKDRIALGLELYESNNLSYDLSYQKPETNTVAVNKNFELVENGTSNCLIRPGGHGALIENLNDIKTDLIFVKNIDNVCSNKSLNETVKYKKALASVLLDLQEQVFAHAKFVETYDGQDESYNFELRAFLEQELGIFSMELCRMNNDQKLKYFKNKLNRPMRVCGMVKNEGEPGGGPFWVRDKEGTISLQIVESIEIDHTNDHQKVIFSESSHFNPVDLVCAVKDYKGNAYDLRAFVDQDAYFISEKSYQGQDILALEHPGLWNGGMGDWITIFVEVSSKTFNPVKTVNDLLRKAHQ